MDACVITVILKSKYLLGFTATWKAGKDLKLLANASNMIINPPGTIELPETEPGDIFTVGSFDAQALDRPGHYVIDFSLEGGFCYPYAAFDVR